MDNLNRLKGTGLLLHGFELFLKCWLQSLEKQKFHQSLDWDAEATASLNRLPDVFREYYELIHRWPELGFLENDGRFRHKLPPRTYQWRNGMSARHEQLTDYITVISDDSVGWQVVCSVDGQHKESLFQNCSMILSDDDPDINDIDVYERDPKNWDQIEQPFDEFILILIFQELIESSYGDSPLEEVLADTLHPEELTSFFSGVSIDGSARNYYYSKNSKILACSYGEIGSKADLACSPRK